MNAKHSVLPVISRRTLLAGTATAASAYQANDTIRIGVIGTGGRARVLMKALDSVPRTRIAGLADVWDGALVEAARIAPKDAFRTKEYRQLLDRKDIDAVVIGSPDHWHVRMAADACAAGKDVYVEKPLTHTVAEGRTIVEAQNRYKRIVQVGTQQRSMPHLIKAREIVRSGQLGTIHKVHMTWNRNVARRAAASLKVDPQSVIWPEFLGTAPKQDFDVYRFRNWRWFWDFGGGIFTDLMVHWLDTVNWMLDLDVPESATSIGDNIHAKDVWQTPDTVQALLHYPSRQLQLYFEGTFINQRNAAMTELMGTEATLYIDRGRYEVIPEPRRNGTASEWILGSGPRGADFYENPPGEVLHLTDWLECIRTRRTPACPAEEGVKSAAGAHMANHALRTGQVARRKELIG